MNKRGNFLILAVSTDNSGGVTKWLPCLEPGLVPMQGANPQGGQFVYAGEDSGLQCQAQSLCTRWWEYCLLFLLEVKSDEWIKKCGFCI